MPGSRLFIAAAITLAGLHPFLPPALLAQETGAADTRKPGVTFGEVGTTCPGLRYQIFHLERIEGNRLLVGIRLYATPQAPAGGTFVGINTPIPADATQEQIDYGRFDSKPLSLASSEMVDDLTGQTYPALTPDPKARQYIPGTTIATLLPGHAAVLSVQFAIPPPPPPDTGVSSGKQTFSFKLPKAQGSIAKIALPLPKASPAASPPGTTAH